MPNKKNMEYIDYFELQDEVEALLSKRENRQVDIRDYADRYKPDGHTDERSYLDFWHFWLEHVDEDVSNDSYGFAVLEKKAPSGMEWTRPIIDAFLEICPELENGVDMWYSW